MRVGGIHCDHAMLLKKERMPRHRYSLFLLLLLAACSKENNVAIGEANAQVGQPCQTETQCAGAVCVAGFCRVACASDVECGAGSVCLGAGTASGCRLANEAVCTAPGQPCQANGALLCGIDKTCRLPCTDKCAVTQQSCIAGTCVGMLEAKASDTWFSCTSGRSCSDAGIVSCNETSPGPTVLATCANAGLCEQGKATGKCPDATCMPGELKCNDKTLQSCNAQGTGYEDKLPACASAELCQRTKGQADHSKCIEPACVAGKSRCRDGKVEKCADDLTAFEASATCSGAMAQCDPTAAACIALTIDAHEVTRDAYALFVAAGNKPAPPAACATNVVDPDATCMANSEVCKTDCGSHPQVCVDWCDAYAYCAWKGQHLCGKIGGGPVSYEQFADPGKSEWMNACSSGGQLAYPYGTDLVPASCNGALYQKMGTVKGGDIAGCRSTVPGYKDVTDLSGNAAEWDDSCEKIATSDLASASDKCRVRGGSYKGQNAELSCAADRFFLRSQASPEVGFRCCGP
jgi:hypothetical protein